MRVSIKYLEIDLFTNQDKKKWLVCYLLGKLLKFVEKTKHNIN